MRKSVYLFVFLRKLRKSGFERKVIKISGAYHFVSIDDSGGTFQIFRCDGNDIDTLTCHKGYDNSITELTEYNGQVFYTSLFEDNYGVELYQHLRCCVKGSCETLGGVH